jgi:hypothetical protein
MNETVLLIEKIFFIETLTTCKVKSTYSSTKSRDDKKQLTYLILLQVVCQDFSGHLSSEEDFQVPQRLYNKNEIK